VAAVVPTFASGAAAISLAEGEEATVSTTVASGAGAFEITGIASMEW
jgi:hypothetical protein